ncbi:MAG: hypothetical protein IJ705_04850 [Oscillospiraceae bacterium]|nr:hypothetical protein [Oscillospiraceae bacterium]
MKKEETTRVGSPEELNDYIRVSSPAVWIVLAVVIALLLGALAWAVFGTVDVIDAAGNVTSVHPITFVTN